MSRTESDAHALLRGREGGSVAREGSVRELYEHAPYPDLGAGLKDCSAAFSPVLDEVALRGGVNYLEAGCGTGHMLVGVAKRFPDWKCHGIDLSEASLGVALQLADKHGATVTLHRKSYLEPLPFEKAVFDLISAQGTIHHCDDPVGALRNLARHLKPDGYISMHVYGARLDARKFDLKEALSIFEPDLADHGKRFAVYKALTGHRTARERARAFLDTSPLDILRMIRRGIMNMRRRGAGTVWSPPWTDPFRAPIAPWADHFCHPCERAYEVPEFRELVEGAGLEVAYMLAQGKVEEVRVPPELRTRFQQLSRWDQWRFMELMGPARSFTAILKHPD